MCGRPCGPEPRSLLRAAPLGPSLEADRVLRFAAPDLVQQFGFLLALLHLLQVLEDHRDIACVVFGCMAQLLRLQQQVLVRHQHFLDHRRL